MYLVYSILAPTTQQILKQADTHYILTFIKVLVDGLKPKRILCRTDLSLFCRKIKLAGLVCPGLGITSAPASISPSCNLSVCGELSHMHVPKHG